MTFGKDQDAKKSSNIAIIKRKNMNSNTTPEFKQAISDGLKRKWNEPLFRNVGLKNLENMRKRIKISGGKNSRKYENEIAKKIIADKIFLPNEICDRIIIRNGKIIFIEIKRKDGRNQQLKPKQLEFQRIAKEQYEVLYG